jgi:tRNA threonylcarbamoyladenosine biosynthesis protein TsaE
MKTPIRTKKYEETRQLAKEFAASLRGGEIIALYGDLGAGKTTFAQGLAEGLGITTHVNSPTFILLRTYRIMNHESRIKDFYHIDLYRIEDAADIASLGLEEILGQKDAVIAIEWPERMGSLLPKDIIDIQFEYIGENERKITIT